MSRAGHRNTLAAVAAASHRRVATTSAEYGQMDEDTFNMSVRKFLEAVGVTSQREIEIG